MRLISYRHQDKNGVGVMVDDEGFVALSLASPELPDTLRGILNLKDGLAMAQASVQGRQADLNLSEVTLLPVIPEPNAIWALALNYTKHLEETGLTTSPDYPHIFLRQHISQVGHRQPLICPPPEVARAYDYEGELAVIIGKGGRHIPVEKALEHVAGYSIYNEGSVREFQSHNRQFGLGKNFEASGSFGPWLMTPDEFGDPYDQEIIVRLNGGLRQKAEISGMNFKIEQIINYLSTGYVLRPGDVIVSGDPGQIDLPPEEAAATLAKHVGPIKYPGVIHMKPGDTIEVEVTGLGILENKVIEDGPVEYRVL